MAEAEKSFGCQSQEGSTYFKKKEKRTLETFSGKLTTYPNPKFTYRSPIPRVQKVQEAVPTKKKEKRTLETFSEKPTLSTYHSKAQITYRFRFQGIRKSREPFLQKRKKKNINIVRPRR